MLEELDEVDRSVLEHAYGPATNVPETIRALRSVSGHGLPRDVDLMRAYVTGRA